MAYEFHTASQASFEPPEIASRQQPASRGTEPLYDDIARATGGTTASAWRTGRGSR